MVKKSVPDWLNSSLWSTAPPPTPLNEDDDDGRRIGKSSSSDSAAAPSNSSSSKSANTTTTPVRQQATVVPVRPEPPPEVEIRDPLSSSNNNVENGSGTVEIRDPTGDDVSVQAQLLQELSRKVVNIGELRRLASQGIPDGAGIRCTVWKLLLGYLPTDRGLWSSELIKKRSQYKHFKEELLMNPSEITRRLDKSTYIEKDESLPETGVVLPRSEITHGEHPLSLGKSSVWNQFFQDTEIIEQIDRDVKRTHPGMHFFSGESQSATSNREALKNILIVFAKLNPGIRYVQGMNEILAPLFYVFRNDPMEENAACAEADTFFCFVELLSGFRDHFCQQLDNSVVGIRATITRLSRLLKEHDEELWRHLEVTTKVNPQFYAFRWITLLLTQEFNFADSLLIWDTLLSDLEGPQETLLRICCAMLILIRRRLLAGDFTSNLKLLQHYPSTNISHLLYVANKLRTQPAR
ncbi:uncharacterized protein LOC131318098 isoform X1 [Rhododendron vialii]|uniref:uncharacterized protein LOC131318098 isoform X1 n=1 Tax=Rhododendron vialii TaxID=182163 RepID=UPI00265EAF36|nr:uncharacterized protein LOC131318098 isoform X1 [Rhododendron vialii]